MRVKNCIGESRISKKNVSEIGGVAVRRLVDFLRPRCNIVVKLLV